MSGIFTAPFLAALLASGSPVRVAASLDAGVCDLRVGADGVGRIRAPEGPLRPCPPGTWWRCSPVASGRAGPIRGMSRPAASYAGGSMRLIQRQLRERHRQSRRAVLAARRLGGLRGRWHAGRTAPHGRERTGLRLCRPGQDRAAVAVDQFVPYGYGSAVGVADRGRGPNRSRCICVRWRGGLPGGFVAGGGCGLYQFRSVAVAA